MRESTYSGSTVAAPELLHALRARSHRSPNITAVLHWSVEVHRRLLRYRRKEGIERIEPTEKKPTAAGATKCQAMLDAAPPIKGWLTVPWFLGANIPGKKAQEWLFSLAEAAAILRRAQQVGT